MRELRTGNGPGKGRVRRQGGGRKGLLSQHPDWIDALKDAQFNSISSIRTACEEIGLPIISIDTKKGGTHREL